MRARMNAAEDLQAADHDSRAPEKALDLTNQAIKECQDALKADKA